METMTALPQEGSNFRHPLLLSFTEKPTKRKGEHNAMKFLQTRKQSCPSEHSIYCCLNSCRSINTFFSKILSTLKHLIVCKCRNRKETGCFFNQTLQLPLKGLFGRLKKNLRTDLKTYSASK